MAVLRASCATDLFSKKGLKSLLQWIEAIYFLKMQNGIDRIAAEKFRVRVVLNPEIETSKIISFSRKFRSFPTEFLSK